MGYLGAEKDDPNLFRKVMTGAGVGASIGGLTGGLTAAGRAVDAAPQQTLGDVVERMKETAAVLRLGKETAMKEFSTNPEVAAEVLEKMSPEARKLVLKRFDKSWLTRIFGG